MITITITELCSSQVSYLIVDEADNDMDMGKVLHSPPHHYHYPHHFHYHLLTFSYGIREPPCPLQLYPCQDPFLEAGISVPDELPYLRLQHHRAEKVYVLSV